MEVKILASMHAGGRQALAGLCVARGMLSSERGNDTEKRVETKVAKEAAMSTILEGAREKKGPCVRAAKMVHQSEREILR
jgi:hypothetical protein